MCECVRLSLAAVDDHVLRLDAFLQFSHLGMFSSAAEQSRRLQLEVPDLLSVSVQQTVSVLLHQPAGLLLQDLIETRLESDRRPADQQKPRDPDAPASPPSSCSYAPPTSPGNTCGSELKSHLESVSISFCSSSLIS